MKGPETRLVKKIRQAILEEWPSSYIKKIHGGPFQDAGIPDLVGCVEGYFLGLEVKVPGEKPTRLQILNIRQIKAAGGIGGWTTSPQDAVNGIKKALSIKNGPIFE